jgi:hypothetical protein
MRHRLAPLLLVLVAGSAFAAGGAGAPRGKRTLRPKPTHVVIVETAFDTGGGSAATLLPGVAVAAKGAGASPKGKVKLTLAGAIEVTGTVDGAALGVRVQRDSVLYGVDGKQKLGTARTGALVRVTGPAKAGRTPVETAGEFKLRGQIASADLGIEPAELVMTTSWNYQTDKPCQVWAGQKLDGAALVKLPEGVHVEYFEVAGEVSHLRTVGGIEIEGWTPTSNLRERESSAAQPQEPNLVQPTHEVFIDAPIFADATGKKKIGVLRGGVLVEVNKRATRTADGAEKSGLVKVTTPGDAVVEGWVKLADLRALSEKVWNQ